MSKQGQKKPVIRCAIYTRKSTDEGLDQDFNSLDAQREAGEAYIKSQKQEGWECSPEFYDDGGFSGGNLERPALKRLMADVEAGKVDVVVVYKVDRLSRSLFDFARIMGTFEGRTAFVSVTQQFNTASPMGRLVLNVLLSFAQFEREIIGERIRDKIAAQRRRGKWAGGVPVMGYEVDRSNPSPKLLVNAKEAARVRAIFELYLKLGSLLPAVQELENRGWNNKTWTTKKGVIKGGKTFDKGSLYGLLTNPIYIGKVKHKANLYEGEHESIVDPEVFQRVQKLLQRNGRNGGVEVRNRYGALLKGLLQCKACGRTMTHTFTSRGTKRYRYYTCTNAIHSGRQKCPSGSLPAAEMERIVVSHVREISTDAGLQDAVLQQARAHVDEDLKGLKTEQRQLQQQLARQHAEVRQLAVDGQANSAARFADLHEQIAQAENRLEQLRSLIDGVSADRISKDDVASAFADFDELWESLSPREQIELLSLLIAGVEFDVHASTVSVTFHDTGIKTLANSNPGEAA